VAGFFPSDSEARASWAPWLTGAVALAYYVAGASGYTGFGEEGAFVAAARELDVTYPPGAPISVLLSAPFALLPLGPLSFRVAVASGACAALALGLFARALLWTLPHAGVKSAPLSGALATAASLWLGQTPLFAQQALRPQLFAVQLLLSLLVFEALLRFEADEPNSSMRTLYLGAFVQGLCFANHHVYGLLLLPVAAPTLGRVFAYRGFMGLMGHVAAPLLGFSAYAFVPSRLASTAHGALAEQGGLARLALMLGEEPYWGPSWAAPLPVLATLRAGLFGSSAAAGATLLLSAIGFASMLHSSNRRRFGLVWLIALLVPLACVWLMFEPKLREDAWGALLPCALSLVAAAAVGAGQVFERVGERLPRVGRVLAPALVALGLLVFARGAPAFASRAELGDAFDELTRRSLPAHGALFLDDVGSTFHYLGGEIEEGRLRADLSLVPRAFRSFPPLLDARTRAREELTPSVRELAREGRLTTDTLQALSARRPVYIELDELLPAAVYEISAEDGLWAHVLPRETVVSEARSAKATQLERMRVLYRAAGDLSRLPHGASLQLGHTHLLQAVRRAGLGDGDGARDYLSLCRALGLDDPRVARLEQALASKTAVEIASYLHTR
jgi:Protein of unknown function (DUF2723)